MLNREVFLYFYFQPGAARSSRALMFVVSITQSASARPELDELAGPSSVPYGVAGGPRLPIAMLGEGAAIADAPTRLACLLLCLGSHDHPR